MSFSKKLKKWQIKIIEFREGDFKKPMNIIKKLRDAEKNSDFASLYIKTKINQEFIKWIMSIEDIPTKLFKLYFNELLKLSFFNEIFGWDNSNLSEEIKLLMNRLILENIYHEEIENLCPYIFFPIVTNANEFINSLAKKAKERIKQRGSEAADFLWKEYFEKEIKARYFSLISSNDMSKIYEKLQKNEYIFEVFVEEINNFDVEENGNFWEYFNDILINKKIIDESLRRPDTI